LSFPEKIGVESRTFLQLKNGRKIASRFQRVSKKRQGANLPLFPPNVGLTLCAALLRCFGVTAVALFAQLSYAQV